MCDHGKGYDGRRNWGLSLVGPGARENGDGELLAPTLAHCNSWRQREVEEEEEGMSSVRSCRAVAWFSVL